MKKKRKASAAPSSGTDPVPADTEPTSADTEEASADGDTAAADAVLASGKPGTASDDADSVAADDTAATVDADVDTESDDNDANTDPMPAAPTPEPLAFTPSQRAGIVAVCCMAALFAFSAAITAAGRLTGQETLTLVGGYGVVFFGVGAAPFQLKCDLDLYARLTGAVLVGFSVLLGVGALMADIHGLWHPILAAAVVGVVAIALHLLGLSRAQSAYPARTQPRSRPRVWARQAAARAHPTGLLLTIAGTAMWLAPALWTRDPVPTYWGMLLKLGPLWYAGIAVVLIGFIVGRRSEINGAVSALSFGLASTLTPALVYGAPRSTTALKQMQLTQYVLDHHYIRVTSGIYPAFSAMFSGMAWFCRLLHIQGTLGPHSLFAIAAFWPVLLVFMRIATVRLLTGRLLPTTSRRWGAVILVLLVDAIGADYFSPQSIGYVMAIGAAALACNGLNGRPFRNRITFCLLLLVGVTLSPTHELSPYMLAGALLILAVFGQAPWWTFVPVALPAVAWAGVVHSAIKQNFSFGALFQLSNFRPPVTVSTAGLARLPIVGIQSHALLGGLLILIGLGAAGFFSNIRHKRVWAYGLCPLVGLGFIAINPYGNEGIFRAALFAIPWIAVIAMSTRLPRFLSRRPTILDLGMAACFAALMTTFVVAAYGMDATDILYPADVAVANYVSSLPPRNAFVLSFVELADPADAVPFTVDYSSLDSSQVFTQSLLDADPTEQDLLGLADRYGFVAFENGGNNSSPLYIIWTRSMMLYAQEYGLASPQQLLTWLHLLQSSPNWKLVNRDGASYLFRIVRPSLEPVPAKPIIRP